MKCPSCGKEMEEGYIYNINRGVGIIWYPKGTHPGIVTSKSVNKKRGITLSSYSLGYNRSKLSSVICRKCNIGFYNFDKNASPDFFSDWFINDAL